MLDRLFEAVSVARAEALGDTYSLDPLDRLIRDLERREHPEEGLMHISAALLPILRKIHSNQKEAANEPTR
jgi:hypothetical protein